MNKIVMDFLKMHEKALPRQRKSQKTIMNNMICPNNYKISYYPFKYKENKNG